MPDLRPDPKPRKHPQIAQYYDMWDAVTEEQKRHKLRERDITLGKCNLDLDVEVAILDGNWSSIHLPQWERMTKPFSENGATIKYVLLPLDKQQRFWAQSLAMRCEDELPVVWAWLNSIHGIGPGLAAKLLALTDDIAKFATISKYWRFSGQGIYEYWVDANGEIKAPRDGWKSRKGKKGEWTLYGRLVPEGTEDARPIQRRGSDIEKVNVWTVTEPKPGWRLEKRADRKLKNWVCPFNSALRSAVWLVGDQFVKQNTPVYRNIYDREKARLRVDHPECIKVNGRTQYNDGHLHNMAMRKARKIFLQHLWLVWRESEGLPVSEPWIISIGGHQDIIPPPNWPL